MTIRPALLVAAATLAALQACTQLPAEYGVTRQSQSTLPAAPPPPGLPPESAYPPASLTPPPAGASAAPTIVLAQAPAPPPTVLPYLNRTWRWQGTLFRDGKRVTPDAPERYTVQFTPDARVTVRADCNRGSASYVLGPEAPQIAIVALATTKMGCPAGSASSEFVRQLDTVSGWLMDKGDLVLAFKADAGTMRFRAE